MSQFAADLYDVIMDRGAAVYRTPAEFFALTYPTYNLRELAKDVVHRLGGKNDKTIRQLELTYGGGKTHTLITLLHLVRDPASLPNLPAVQEFTQHIGMTPPATRVAALAFDKLDVEKGMEVKSPAGKARWLKNPWSILAYQLAGSDGLRALHADGKDAERESAPAENLLVELPCEYTDAAKVVLKPRTATPPPPPPPLPPPPPPGILVASAYLKPGEIQDLADQIGEVGNTAVGYDMKFLVRIEIGSDGKRPPESVIAKLNAKLAEVSKGLKLE